MAQFKRIALLMSKNIGYNRDVIEGIYAYSQRGKDWIFHDAAPARDSLEWIKEWRPDGIIGHIYERELAQLVRGLNLPLVNTTDSLADLDYPLADVNHFQVGLMAGQYFKSLEKENYAYLGSGTLQYSRQRYVGFCQAVGTEVRTCNVEYLPRISDLNKLKKVLDKIELWVKSLPKPVAIFCSNDVPARDLADQCLAAGIKVPEEVAILGVDNDLVECRLSRPPLSSIEIPAARIGFGAAEMLDQLFEGPLVRDQRVFNPPPIGVVERGSSESDWVSDRLVRQSLEIIKRDFAILQGVDDVVAKVGLGRRSLEIRFRKATGGSILKVIQQNRVRHAKKLLNRETHSIEQIAVACGFHSGRRFSQAFKRLQGMSPVEYRKRGCLGVIE